MPTPAAEILINGQEGPLGEIRLAKTERSGSALVARKPINKATTKSITRLFRLVRVVPTTSPILAMDLSTPKEKKVVPRMSGIEDRMRDRVTGPNFPPFAPSKEKPGQELR